MASEGGCLLQEEHSCLCSQTRGRLCGLVGSLGKLACPPGLMISMWIAHWT